MNTNVDTVQKQTAPGGGVYWHAVAQENTNAGDHWVDFNQAEGDDILVRGHTVKVDTEYYFQNKYIDEIPGLLPEGPPPPGGTNQPEPDPANNQDAVDLDALVERIVRAFNGTDEAIRVRDKGKLKRGAEDDDLVLGDAETTKLHGHRRNDLLIGGDSEGIAKLKGGTGDDVFAFGLGSDKDRIIDVSATVANRIDLTAAGFETFNEVTSAATNRTTRVTITAEDGSVLGLKELQIEDLQENRFELA